MTRTEHAVEETSLQEKLQFMSLFMSDWHTLLYRLGSNPNEHFDIASTARVLQLVQYQLRLITRLPVLITAHNNLVCHVQ